MNRCRNSHNFIGRCCCRYLKRLQFFDPFRGAKSIFVYASNSRFCSYFRFLFVKWKGPLLRPKAVNVNIFPPLRAGHLVRGIGGGRRWRNPSSSKKKDVFRMPIKYYKIYPRAHSRIVCGLVEVGQRGAQKRRAFQPLELGPLKPYTKSSFDKITQSYADLLHYSNIISDLASKGPESQFFKRTIELMQSVEKQKETRQRGDSKSAGIETGITYSTGTSCQNVRSQY